MNGGPVFLSMQAAVSVPVATVISPRTIVQLYLIERLLIDSIRTTS